MSTEEVKNRLAGDFLEAIGLERESDIELVNDLLSRLSGKKLSQQGLAILNLNITTIKTGLGGRTVIELSNDSGYTISEEIDAGEIRVGDIVKIEKVPSSTASKRKLAANASSKKHNPKKGARESKANRNENQDDLSTVEGVITKVTSKMVVAAIDDNYEDNLLKLQNERLWIAKISNSITYKRMESTMRKLKEIQNPSPIMQLLLGTRKFIPPNQASLKTSFERLQFHNEQLNDSQKKAINFSLNSDLSIIHGPPGTGKTYTLIELIQQLLSNGHERVLVCGPSNISVDTIVERLDKVIPYTKLLRIGHPARLLPSIQKHSLDYISKSGDTAQVTNDIKNEIAENLKTLKKLKSYKERKQVWNDNRFLKKDLRLREKKVSNELIYNAKAVVATLHGASSRELVSAAESYAEQGKPLFDCLIIDEVSQSLEPQCWIPIISHPGICKLILAGDNKQLPPTIKLDDHDILSGSTKSNKQNLIKVQHAKEILTRTIFDRLIKIHSENHLKQLLDVQYRMNVKIMEFSSRQLYGNKLIAAESVKNRLLSDLTDVLDTEETGIPVVWYDTQGGDFPEQKLSEDDLNSKSSLTSSKYNKNEASLALKHVQDLVAAKVPQEFIGVISPYSSQIELLKKIIRPKYPAVEISTVDGFQGREKDVIILSLVRSNFDKSIGFLKDERRLNVAITRPKRQLCIIGDMETLGESRNRFLSQWVKWAEDNAEIRYPDLAELEFQDE